MDGATIFVTVLALGFVGFIVYMAVLSRKKQTDREGKGPKSRSE